MFQAELYRDILFNSVNLALSVTALATLIAYPLALILSRYRLPAQSGLHTLLLLPLIVPPFVGVLGVRQLFSRFGSVNCALMNLNITESPINWLGRGGAIGIIGLQTIHLVPLLYLTISASLKNAHVSLEEAALVTGASRWRILRKVIIPLSMPGWFAGATLVFIGSLTDLGTPLVFEYRDVLAVQIYNMLSDLNENPVGYAFVVSTCFMSIALFSLSKASVAYGSFAGSGRARQGISARSLPMLTTLVVIPSVAIYAGVALLPQLVIILLSLSGEWFMSVFPSQWTLHHFAEVVQHPLTTRSLVISIALSFIASIFTIVLGFLTAYNIRKGSRTIRALLEVCSIAPLAIPGIVFAFGFIGAFAGTLLDNRMNPFPLLIAAYTIRRVPAMVRSAYAGLQEANQSLEEAAYMVGASGFVTMRRIVFPLIGRHLLVGGILTFAYSMIEVSDSLLLALEARFYPVSKAMYALMGRPDGVEVASALGVIVMVVMAGAFTISDRVTRRGAARRGASILVIIFAMLLSERAHAQVNDELTAITPHWEGIKAEFELAFADSWRQRTGRGLKIRWLDVGGMSDIVKYIKSQYRVTPAGIGVDLVFGGGTDSMLELERYNALEPARVQETTLQGIPMMLSGIQLRSPGNIWFANAVSTFGILYNKRAVERLNLPVPSRWSDLGTPAYRDLVGGADPRKSGSNHAMFEVILQGYGWQSGWELIQRFAHNVRNFSGTASQIGKEVATGEIVYGIAIDTYAGDIIRQVGNERIGFVLPEDFLAVNGDCIAQLRGAPHPELASAFIDFVLSEAGQRLWYGTKGVPGGPRRHELGKLPVRPSLYGTIPSASLVSRDPFSQPHILAYDAVTAGNRWNLVNDLFGVFIIDPHSRLVQLSDALLLKGLPISAEAAAALSPDGSWGADSALRTKLVARWADEARRMYPSPASIWHRFRWLPSALFALFLLLATARRLSRRLAQRRSF
jgi:iron(III) transport system permease protein